MVLAFIDFYLILTTSLSFFFLGNVPPPYFFDLLIVEVFSLFGETEYGKVTLGPQSP
jgi:hypothetical protein